MEFFSSAITTLQTLVVALGAGLGVWGVVNLLEGYGSDNPGSQSQGIKQLICTHSEEGGQPPMNEKLEKLNQEIEKTEKKLRWAQQEEKRLTHQAKALTRKERTHRLCTRAAMLESYLPHPEAITDEQVSLFLKLLFRQDSTRQLMEKVFAGSDNFQGEDAGRKRP